MLVLRSSPASPFGRKVKLSASILGLFDRIQIVDADTLNPEDSIRQQNPLGKIPALLLENGDVLYDSRVIVDYLDHLAGGGRVIPNGPERFTALRDQALADGIMDAALLQVYEGRFRQEDKREPKWVDHQADKVRRGLDHAEAHLSTPVQNLQIGQRSEEHTSELQSRQYLVCRLLLEKKKKPQISYSSTLSPLT